MVCFKRFERHCLDYNLHGPILDYIMRSIVISHGKVLALLTIEIDTSL